MRPKSFYFPYHFCLNMKNNVENSFILKPWNYPYIKLKVHEQSKELLANKKEFNELTLEVSYTCKRYKRYTKDILMVDPLLALVTSLHRIDRLSINLTNLRCQRQSSLSIIIKQRLSSSFWLPVFYQKLNTLLRLKCLWLLHLVIALLNSKLFHCREKRQITNSSESCTRLVWKAARGGELELQKLQLLQLK